MTDDGRKPKPARRDVFVTAAFGFVGAGFLLGMWPFVAQMFPSAETEKSETLDVDLSAIAPGKTTTVTWRRQPIMIRRRTVREIELARAVPLAALIDRMSRNEALAPEINALDANRIDKDHPQWLVVSALCPHDGCVIRALEPESGAELRDGFACPCDNSRFDLAGRVRSGPARTNLAVPRYRVIDAQRLRLG